MVLLYKRPSDNGSLETAIPDFAIHVPIKGVGSESALCNLVFVSRSLM